MDMQRKMYLYKSSGFFQTWNGSTTALLLPYSSLCMFWQVKRVRIRFRCPARSRLSVSRSSGCSDGWKLPSHATSSSNMASTSTPYKACRSPGGGDVHIQECVTDQAAVLNCLKCSIFIGVIIFVLNFVWYKSGLTTLCAAHCSLINVI